MKNSPKNLPSLKWSFTFVLFFAFIIAGLMACSNTGKNNNNTTKAKIQKTPAKTGKASPNISRPLSSIKALIIVNGEKMNTPKKRNIVSRIKPKYIKSLDVLKATAAKENYGKSGKNGAVKIKLNVPKKVAFNDLFAHPPDSIAWMLKPKNIYVAAKHMPKLKGGYPSLAKKVQYPASCKNAGIQGRVTIQFIVNKQGMPTNVHVTRGIGGGCDKAAVEAVRKYARFTPGKNKNGKPIKVKMSLPVVFRLKDTNSTGQKLPNGEIFFQAVGQMPKLKGTYKSFEKHVHYPKSCKNAGIQGRVTVAFIVNKQGIPTHVHVTRGIGDGCDKAAVKAVKKYARFTPGKQKGKPVPVEMSLPIVFRLKY